MPASLTASGLARAAACPASHALPSVATPGGAGARRGTLVHAFYEAVNAGTSRDEALAQVPDATVRAMLAAIDLAEIPVGRAEVAFAYDWRTGRARELGSAGHRDYRSARPTEIPGTVDLLALDLPRSATVIDWSTDHDLDVPAKRAQVDVYLLMVARAYGLTQVHGAIGSHRHDGALAWHRWGLDVWDLAELGSRVKATVERAEAARALVAVGRTPDVTMGGHCRDCRAFLACPGVAGAVRLFLETTSAEGMAPADLGAAYDRVRMAERSIEQLRDAARLAVERDGALPLPGGKRLVSSTDSRGRKSLRTVRA